MRNVKEIVVSGMRPTGPLHIGHYHGVIKNWIELQEKYKCYYFVADWHALTTEYKDPSDIRRWVFEMLVDWLALGIDPSKAVLFIQSEVEMHAELHLLLSMLTPLGWLNRVPSYKDMIQQLKDRDLTTYGFLGYPLLQAADIAVYKGAYVPVGEDQVAHIELAREVVRRFNDIYKTDILKEPKALLTPTPKVPGLDGRKMSKSYNNCIFISDDSKTLKKKIMPAITDPQRMRRSDPGDPDVCIIHDYHKLYSPQDIVEWCEIGCRSAAIGCVDCKNKLLEYMNLFWDPIRERRSKLISNPSDVWEIVESGCVKARKVASSVIKKVRDIVGISYRSR